MIEYRFHFLPWAGRDKSSLDCIQCLLTFRHCILQVLEVALLFSITLQSPALQGQRKELCLAIKKEKEVEISMLYMYRLVISVNLFTIAIVRNTNGYEVEN